jgi:hypothetical protein
LKWLFFAETNISDICNLQIVALQFHDVIAKLLTNKEYDDKKQLCEEDVSWCSNMVVECRLHILDMMC